MKCCDFTFDSTEENLACEEVLLDCCEQGIEGPLLRFWEPAGYAVVVGYANHVQTEVNLAFCAEAGIPVLRRFSGGGTVLQGPGCLNYALFLPVDVSGPLAGIHSTNAFVLDKHVIAISTLLRAPVERQGDTDLAIGGMKFSGNAQRRRRRFLVFHGCFLLNLDLEMVEKTLHMPSRQPGYRLNRPHRDFLLNLRLEPSALKNALRAAWKAVIPCDHLPFDLIRKLAREKYALDEWNLKF
jgi:lipoate-protein ligase A